MDYQRGAARPMASHAVAARGEAEPGRTDPALSALSQRLNASPRVTLQRALDAMMNRRAMVGGSRPLPAAPMAGAVLQRAIATQVALGANSTIESVRIVGRPPNAHGSSAGDHLTAFAVRKFGAIGQLTGLNFWEAVERIDQWVLGLQDLPGWHMIDTMPTAQRAKLDAAMAHLNELRASFPEVATLAGLDRTATVPSVIQATTFQDLLGAYFDVVELLPLSTINVAAVSKGTAGKGKGEAGPARILRQLDAQARTTPNSVDATAALRAIIGLFDAKAAAFAATATDEGVGTMAPGLPISMPRQARIDRLIAHHLVSLRQSFPTLMAALRTAGTDEHALTAHLNTALVPELVDRLNDELGTIYVEMGRNKAKIDYVSLKTTKSEIKAHGKEVERAQARNQILQTGSENLIREITALGGSPTARPPELDVTTKTGRGHRKATRATNEPGDTLRKKPKREDEATIVPNLADVVEDETEDSDLEEDVTEDVTSTTQGPAELAPNLAVQVRLGPDGAISDVVIAGRPPSPFSGTMGAHTTAWTVHVDRIRAALIGTRPDAHDDGASSTRMALNTLAEEARKAHDTLSPVFDYSEEMTRHSENGERATKAFTADWGALETARGAARISLIQTAVGALLSYVNNIPGSTLDEGNTDGRGEGKYRRFLLAYEHGKITPTPGELQAAILGLLDIPKDICEFDSSEKGDEFDVVEMSDASDVVENENKSDIIDETDEIGDSEMNVAPELSIADKKLAALVEVHKDIAEKAYPKAYKDSGLAAALAKGNLEESLRKIKKTKVSAPRTTPTSDTSGPKTAPGTSLSSFAVSKPDLGDTSRMEIEDKEKKAGPNRAYLYEDLDMYRILNLEVQRLLIPNAIIAAPSDNLMPGQLTGVLTPLVPADRAQTRAILAPFNLNANHWVGIIITLPAQIPDQPMPPLPQVRYLDPLAGNRPIPPDILVQIRAVPGLGNTQPQDAHRYTQTDYTSCGPMTIHNLLLHARHQLAGGPDVTATLPTTPQFTATLREHHIGVVDTNVPGANFRQHQADNIAAKGSTFNVAAYLKSLGTVTFSESGMAHILTVAQAITNLGTAGVRDPILAALGKARTVDLGTFLGQLRGAFHTAIQALAPGPNADRTALADILKAFWQPEGLNADLGAIDTNLLLSRDPDEALAIADRVNSGGDMGRELTEIQERIAQQKEAIRKMQEESATKK